MKLKAHEAVKGGLRPQFNVDTQVTEEFIIYSLQIPGAKKEELKVELFTERNLRKVRVIHKGLIVWTIPINRKVNDGDVKAQFANRVLKIKIPNPEYHGKKIDTEEARSSIKPADDGQKKQAQEECPTTPIKEGHEATASSPVVDDNQKEHLLMDAERKRNNEEAVKSDHTKREGSGTITETSVINEADKPIVAEHKNGTISSYRNRVEGNTMKTIDEEKIESRQFSRAGLELPNSQTAKPAEGMESIPATKAGFAGVKKLNGERGIDSDGKRVQAEDPKLDENKSVSGKIINSDSVHSSLLHSKGRNCLTEGDGGSQDEADDKFRGRTTDMHVAVIDDCHLFVNIAAAFFVLVGLAVWVLRPLHHVYNH